jgi:hypothetical protein
MAPQSLTVTVHLSDVSTTARIDGFSGLDGRRLWTASGFSHRNAMRVVTIFFNRFKLICPVQPQLQK